MSTNYYEEGYTKPFFIKAFPGLYGDLRGVHEPMMYEFREKLNAQGAKVDAETFVKLMHAAVAQHVKSWNLQHKGKSLPVGAAAMARMPPNLFVHLYRVVAGFDPDDSDHSATNPQVYDDFAANLLKAAETGQPVGDVELAAKEKNSPAG